jgi:hypothetical protein
MNYIQNFYFMNTQTLNFTNLIPDNEYITIELKMYLSIQFFIIKCFKMQLITTNSGKKSYEE